MRKSTLIHKGLTFAAITLMSVSFSQKAQAQEDVATLLKAGVDDASKLIEAYTTPFFRGFGAGLNGGWYNTAKPHGLGRFDLTINMNLAMVPTSDKTYDATTLGFTKLALDNPANKIGQTLAGEVNPSNNPVYVLRTDNPTLPPGNNAVELAKFDAPPGAGLPFSGAPTAQLAIGLIKNTELMIRYMPTIALGDQGDIGLVGFGLKHDIKQWIPGISAMPFDLSAYFGYTSMKLALGLDLQPESGVPNASGNNGVYADQVFNLNTKATTMGLIVSKKLAVLTAYGAFNYQTSKTTLSLDGDFPLNSVNSTTGAEEIIKVSNPVSFDVDGANGATATLGLRMKLLILTFQGAYTFGKYPMATAGIGINIDWK